MDCSRIYIPRASCQCTRGPPFRRRYDHGEKVTEHRRERARRKAEKRNANNVSTRHSRGLYPCSKDGAVGRFLSFLAFLPIPNLPFSVCTTKDAADESSGRAGGKAIGGMTASLFTLLDMHQRDRVDFSPACASTAPHLAQVPVSATGRSGFAGLAATNMTAMVRTASNRSRFARDASDELD